MKLRGTEFGKVLAASGIMGFFGEGYWFHRYLRPFGLDFRNITFVAKTTTLAPRPGNMTLRADFKPAEHLPRCIHVRPWQGVALNAVGLSGPGAAALFTTGRWQEREEPFFISFMAVAPTAEERRDELLAFAELFKSELPRFRGKVGLQINYSCHNAGLRLSTLLDEVDRGLSTASRLGIPLMPKFNLLIPPEAARDISHHPHCDALCVSNTIPYGEMGDKIDWRKLFGARSPLAEYGGGGLSGKPLLPLLLEWLQKARPCISKPINAGGGILSLRDAQCVIERGADSVFLGSIAFLRPWRVAKIAKAVNQ